MSKFNITTIIVNLILILGVLGYSSNSFSMSDREAYCEGMATEIEWFMWLRVSEGEPRRELLRRYDNELTQQFIHDVYDMTVYGERHADEKVARLADASYQECMQIDDLYDFAKHKLGYEPSYDWQ